MILAPEQAAAPLYRRSPFQIALLLFVTGGLYLFYWAFKVRRWCEVTLEKPNQSTWKTIALVVPIFNLFLLFDLGMLVKGVAYRAGIAVGGAIAMLGVISFFVATCYRLPSPYWIISFADFIPLTALYFSFERAQLSVHGAAALPQKFVWLEWVLIVFFGTILLLVLVGLGLPQENGERIPHFAFAYVALAFMVAALVYVKVQSDKLLGGVSAPTPLDAASISVP